MKGWDEAMKNTDEKTISAVQELEWFREVLLGKGASENTVRVYLASVRRFYESHEEVTVEALQERMPGNRIRSPKRSVHGSCGF